MVSISFLYPRYLFFLFLIPLFIFIHIATLRASKTTAMKFANFEAIARIKGVDIISKNIIVLISSVLILFLLVMSISGLTMHTVIDATEYSFIIALDSSESMGAKDLLPNRMEAAKRSASAFIDSLPLTTRAGIISFSGNAIIEQDLTDSKGAMKSAVNDIQVGEISGTDIYEAVITGTNLLRAEKTRAIVLLSDGQLNVGIIDDAVGYANDNDIVVHTIGIGTEEGGETQYGLSKLDEDSLKALAYNTNGQYFRAIDEAELLNSFNEVIGKTKRKVGINFSNYLLIASILLFALQYYLINSRYRRLI